MPRVTVADKGGQIVKRSTSSGNTAFWLAGWGLMFLNGWLAWTCWAQWDQAYASQTQLAHLERLASKIEALRKNPIQVEEGARTNDALAQLVETAARQVNLNPEQIVRIDPSESRRIEKTPYLEQRTSIELREIPLRKIVEFSLALEQSGKGIDVPTLSIRIPAGVEPTANKEELWNAQILLTCRNYEASIPTSPVSKLP